MKFLKFVSCCGVDAGASKEMVAETAAVRRTEETTSLVARASRRVRWKRKMSGSEEWKPTLGSISEDNGPAVVAAERVAAQRAVKRKSGGVGGGGSSYGGRRDSRDIPSIANYDEEHDHRRGRYTGVFPVFAPTPFML